MVSGSFCGLTMNFQIHPIMDTKLRWVYITRTFCDKECLIEYLKANVTDQVGFEDKNGKV